jgi:hypothetical protein
MKRPSVVTADAIPSFEDQQSEIWPCLMESERDQRVREASADQDAIHSIALRHPALSTSGAVC